MEGNDIGSRGSYSKLPSSAQQHKTVDIGLIGNIICTCKEYVAHDR